MSRRPMNTLLCLAFFGICSCSWAFTAPRFLPAATGFGSRKNAISAMRTAPFSGVSTSILRSERSHNAAYSEIYFSNSTRFMSNMAQQRKDLRQLEQTIVQQRQHPTMEIASYDFPGQQTNTDSSEMVFLETTSPSSKEEGHGGLSDVWKARLLLIGAAALYGTNFSLVKLLGDVMPVGVSTSLRFGAASLATLPFLLKDINNENKDAALMAAWLGFEVGMWNSIGYVSQAVGLGTTPAAESAFICSLAVVTVPILDFLAGRKLESRQWIGAFLAVLGVAFLELMGGPGSSSSGGLHALSTGDLLTLVQPFAFGIGFWRMEHAMHRFPDQASRMTAAQLLAVFMASVTYGLWAIDLSTLQSYPWAEWMTDNSLLFSIFWTGIVTTAMTIYMENKAMETLSAAETTLIFSTEPLWGTAFAALVMGEELGPNVGMGAAFILAACMYSNLGMEGIQKVWKGSLSTASNYYTRGYTALKQSNTTATNHSYGPFSPKQQMAWFTSSAATSWAWWKVAASNLPSLDDATDVFEQTIATIVEKIL